MKRCWFWFHDWGKWERIERTFKVILLGVELPLDRLEIWQRKTCKKCGFMKEKKLSS